MGQMIPTKVHSLWLAAALALAGVACSSSNDNPAGTPGDDASASAETGSDDGSTPDGASPADGTVADGGTPADGATGHDGGDAAASLADAATNGGHDGGSTTGGDAAADSGSSGGAAAGKAGVDAYCTEVCSHQHDCAATLDAGTVDTATCIAACQSANEGPGAATKSEILRADYVAALGSCVASASCTDVVSGQASTTCADSVVTSNPVSQYVATFCKDFSTSSCNFTPLPSCVTTFGFYSDAVVQALITCVTGTLPCITDGGDNQVSCINSAVSTQP
jgi:hypothetical protein